MDLLRISTAGSVDDGKSTLIGRLLYDTHSILEDQLRALEASSRRRGEPLNLALLTDGLRAEREQGITIDVAYRYFSTSRRAFIIADTPGHAQYTRNMVTGASTAELAIILVDARKGLQTQSRRHGFIAALLGVPHIVLAVNKMDAVDYAQDAFERIAAEYRAFASKLDVRDLTCIPVSALHGDNVARHSPAMPWYDGTTLLHHLEHVHGDATRNKVDFRFAVQQVIRPHQDFRGLAGRVASGSVAPGEEVVVLPAGLHTTVKAIETFDGPREEAAAGDSVVITLNDDVDAGRGDMIVRRLNLPAVGQDLDAMICWMSERPLDVRRRYLITHTTRTAPAFVSRLVYRIDIDTLHRQPAGALALNEIGRVELRASVPLMFDAYQTNRETGSFILIDPDTNETVAAGIVRGPKRTAPMAPPAAVMQPWNVTRDAREARNGHGAICVWLTGLSGSGKSTIARALERRLFEAGIRTALLDGDILRHGLNRDLAFAAQDRRENIRRAGEVARLFFEHGDVVICTFISPFAEDRARVRALFPEGCFIEVHVDAEVDECERRDPKGLYARARAGAIPEFTGISSPYEPPEHPDMRIDTMAESSEQAAARLAEVVRERIARD